MGFKPLLQTAWADKAMPTLRGDKLFMSYYRRANVAGGTYFFTLVTYRRQKILCDAPIRDALHQAIKNTQSKHPFVVDAWVLMPDHLHCIWTLPQGDANFSQRWSIIKRRVSISCTKQYKQTQWLTDSKKKHRESTLWQRRFWEHQIRDQNDFNNHLDYIHFNPVKHGLCEQPILWPYSTFHRYVKEGKYEKNWAGIDLTFDKSTYGE